MSSIYARFADAPASQAYDLVCLEGTERYFEEAAGGLIYDRITGNISYATPNFGTQSFTAADRTTFTETESNYRKVVADGRSLLGIRKGSGQLNASYVRAVSIGRVDATGYARTMSCVAGIATLEADEPTSTITASIIRVHGSAGTFANGSLTNYYLTAASGTMTIDPRAGTMQTDIVLFGKKDGNGDEAELGRFKFNTNLSNRQKGYSGRLSDNMGTTGDIAGAAFGPSATEIGVAFFLSRTDATGALVSFSGELIAAR